MKKIKYTNYDYEEYYKDNLELANEDTIKEMLQQRKIHSVYATKTIKSGKILEIEIYPEFTKAQAIDLKLPKSSKAMKNLNDRNARKRLERLINTNFKDGDYWITFTYSNEYLPSTMEKALQNMKNFIRRINYRREKLKLHKARYIYVTEFSKAKKIRCHHHLIMDNELGMEIVESMWNCSRRNNIRKVAEDKEGLLGLATYLSKDPRGSKRWCSSLNLKKPKERKSYTTFRGSHVKKIIQDRNKARTLAESRYKHMEYIGEEIRYNEVNCKFYIYIKMRDRR